MSSTHTVSTEESGKPKKVSEFNDGRKLPKYEWKASFTDWFKHGLSSDYSDAQVESRLLSYLPFFPNSDGKRKAKIINTDIGNGNYIHEFYIENTEEPKGTLARTDAVKDVVLVHGYAASLGLFFDNFDLLSSVPGIRIHAIDLLGFGLSLRPKYPKFGSKTAKDVADNENWFVDSLEEWRRRRGIDRFVLIGHSFGGYLSCAYALKYNCNLVLASGASRRMIDKLVLLSPVGVERHQNSLLRGAALALGQVSPARRQLENDQDPTVDLSRELTANQQDIIDNTEETPEPETPGAPELRGRRTVRWLWEKNVSPFSLVRNLGPFRSISISRWTTHRFSHVYFQDPQKFQTIHDYFYRIFNSAGSGEYAITRVLTFGALARMPLLDRCPEPFVKMGLPTLWVYGDKDWMNEEAGFEMTEEINRLAAKEGKAPLASYSIIRDAGHHLYLDNPPDFAKLVFKFLGL